MEFISFLIDFVLHIDKHLEAFVIAYGPWVYGLLFLIVFVETGLVVMPFLPGDSLLFIVGALCGAGLMSFGLAVPILLVAAILGDQCNFSIGRFFGPKVFKWESSRFFNRKAFDQAHAFYERFGGVTIILARFMPFIRTFAPFVAGVADMKYRTFTIYNLVGAGLWAIGVTTLGYYLGQVDVVREHVEIAAIIIVAVSLIPVAIEVAKHKKQSAKPLEDTDPVVSDS